MSEFLKPDKIGSLGACHGEILDLSFLIGKSIVGAGLLSGECGGLGIDYQDGNKGVVKRVVLNYNDLGIWIRWNGIKDDKDSEDVLRAKVGVLFVPDAIGTIQICDEPKERRFSFKSKGKTILSLSPAELKTMGRKVCDLFNREQKNVEEIIYEIDMWVHQ